MKMESIQWNNSTAIDNIIDCISGSKKKCSQIFSFVNIIYTAHIRIQMLHILVFLLLLLSKYKAQKMNGSRDDSKQFE